MKNPLTGIFLYTLCLLTHSVIPDTFYICDIRTHGLPPYASCFLVTGGGLLCA